jgi:hypothetical protein
MTWPTHPGTPTGQAERFLEPKAGCPSRHKPDAKPDATRDNNRDTCATRRARCATATLAPANASRTASPCAVV